LEFIFVLRFKNNYKVLILSGIPVFIITPYFQYKTLVERITLYPKNNLISLLRQQCNNRVLEQPIDEFYFATKTLKH
jgi:hypothetical protein